MTTNRAVFLFLLSMLYCSCLAQPHSTDFTKEGSFTEGIEGPATDREGNVYAVNFAKQGTIGKVTPDGDASLFVELSNGSIANGIRFNTEDEMFVADYTNHNILKIDLKS